MGRNTTLIKELQRFKKKVQRDFSIQKLILFGSQATGRAKSYSDIDLVLVSPKFRRLDFIERGAKMYDYWDLRLPVDFLCYSPEEFDRLRKRVSIVSEAIKEGIEI